MISAADFKKQISKPLGNKMRSIGFRGSGFDYLMDSEAFVFAFGIQASRYGGQCCAEYGIQPRSITRLGNHKLDLKKLKFASCELRSRLNKPPKGGQWWKYSDNENENIQIANEIFDLFNALALPTITAFKNDPNILDKIDISDLDNPYLKVSKKLHGIHPGYGDVRFAWALTIFYEQTNPTRSKEFAAYGLSNLEADNLFFGRADFERILANKNGA